MRTEDDSSRESHECAPQTIELRRLAIDGRIMRDSIRYCEPSCELTHCEEVAF